MATYNHINMKILSWNIIGESEKGFKHQMKDLLNTDETYTTI